jgi:excisionase family DNA binding protein
MQTAVERQAMETPEAASYLGVTAGTLTTWRCTRKVQVPFTKIGRKVIYRKSDLDRFLLQNTRGAEAVS